MAPDSMAVWKSGVATSYRDLDEAVSRAAGCLKLDSESHRVAICVDDPRDTMVWLFAALRATAEIILLSTRLPRAARETTCTDLGIRMYISHERLDVEKSRWIDPTQYDDDSPPSVDYLLPLDRPATLVHTSGTAGASKIAVHSLRNHFSSALSSNTRIRVTPSSKWLLSLPLHHVAGLGILFRTFVAGGTVAIQPIQRSIGDAIDLSEATHVSLVPMQLRRLLHEKPFSPHCLKDVLVGGGPVPASLIRLAVEGGYPIRTTYGMTEMSSQIATSDIWTETREFYSSGRVLPQTELVIDTNDEILVRGPSAFLGYLKSGGSFTRRKQGAWIRTGDVGRMDDDELFLLGRRDQMFVSGGENIQPEEIERALLTLNHVELAVVVPVSDIEFGFYPVAFIRSTGPAIDENAMKQQLEETLPSFKIPKRFLEWPDRLDSKAMKVDRKLLAELAASM